MIYSEIYPNYFAFKVKNIKLMGGDHICFMVKDRDLMAEYMISYAESVNGDINFEMNEDFSILKSDLTPTWFSFADMDQA